jgi:hypothetical protein
MAPSATFLKADDIADNHITELSQFYFMVAK